MLREIQEDIAEACNKLKIRYLIVLSNIPHNMVYMVSAPRGTYARTMKWLMWRCLPLRNMYLNKKEKAGGRGETVYAMYYKKAGARTVLELSGNSKNTRSGGDDF